MANDIPTVAEMYQRSLLASQGRWREDPAAPATVRHDTILPPPAPADEGAVRVDVASVPKISALYEKHLRESLNRWKNGGDRRGPVGT